MKTSSTEALASPDAAASTTALLNAFLDKPLARSQQSVEERLRYWQSVANKPALYLKEGTSGSAAERQRRKVAIQSLRKLITKYPTIARKLQSESEVSA